MKVLIGCGVGCLVMIVLLVVLLIVLYKVGMSYYNEWVDEFAEQGYRQVMGQTIEVTDPVTEKTLFTAQMVKLIADSQTDVAIIAQGAEVHGRIEGDLHFRGQAITIEPNAVIEGDLEVQAQAVVIHGRVLGQITGSYQAIEDNRPTTATAPATQPASP